MTVDVVGVQDILEQGVVLRGGVCAVASQGDAQAVGTCGVGLPSGGQVQGVLGVCWARERVGVSQHSVQHLRGGVQHHAGLVEHLDQHFHVGLVHGADVLVHHPSQQPSFAVEDGLLEGRDAVFKHVPHVAVHDLSDLHVVHDLVGAHRHVVDAPEVVAVGGACFRRLTVRKTKLDRVLVGCHTAHVHTHREGVGGDGVGRLDEIAVGVERGPRSHPFVGGAHFQVNWRVGVAAVTEVRLPADNDRRILLEVQPWAGDGALGVHRRVVCGDCAAMEEVVVEHHPTVERRFRRQFSGVAAVVASRVGRASLGSVGEVAHVAWGNPHPNFFAVDAFHVVFHGPRAVAVAAVEAVGERLLEHHVADATLVGQRLLALRQGSFVFSPGHRRGDQSLVCVGGALGHRSRRAQGKNGEH